MGEYQRRCSGTTRGRSRRRPGALGQTCPSVACTMLRYGEVHYHAEQGAQSGIAAAERCGSGSPEAESAARAQAASLRGLQAKLGQRWGGKHSTDCGEPTTFATSVPTADARAARPEPRHAGCGMRADRPGRCRKVLVPMQIRAATAVAKRARKAGSPAAVIEAARAGVARAVQVRAAASLTAAEPGQRGQQCRGGMHAASRAARTAAWLPARAVAELHLLQVGRAACCVADRPPEE